MDDISFRMLDGLIKFLLFKMDLLRYMGVLFLLSVFIVPFSLFHANKLYKDNTASKRVKWIVLAPLAVGMSLGAVLMAIVFAESGGGGEMAMVGGAIFMVVAFMLAAVFSLPLLAYVAFKPILYRRASKWPKGSGAGDSQLPFDE